jgi:hypothetical protein
MDLGLWLAAFRLLHERARSGELAGHAAADYRAGREELARALMASQRLAVLPGQTPRRALRVACALQVDLEGPGVEERVSTLDLSLGGFSALMSRAPADGEPLAARLRLPGAGPLEATVRVANVRAQPGTVRVGFAFEAISREDEERLNLAIFDAVLAQLEW